MSIRKLLDEKLQNDLEKVYRENSKLNEFLTNWESLSTVKLKQEFYRDWGVHFHMHGYQFNTKPFDIHLGHYSYYWKL